MWNPWRHLRDVLAHVTVHTHHLLPEGILAAQRGDTVWLDASLGQRERRSTLAHEIVHYERGPAPTGPWWAQREERTVDAIAVRRLVTLDRVVDALLWTRDCDELAEELWIDRGMLTALKQSLTEAERGWIDEELERRQG